MTATTPTSKMTPRVPNCAVAKLFVVLAVGALMVGACSDDSDSSDSEGDSGTDTTTTTEAPESGDPGDATDTTEPEGDSSGGGEALVGDWTADAADTLAANTANIGMPAGITCTGPMTLSFAGDGTFSAGGTAECAAGGFTVSGTMNTTGMWSALEGGRIEISGATSDGSFDVPGIEIPPVDVVSDGSFAYTIEGDTLSIVFTDPNVGEVTQTWTRV